MNIPKGDYSPSDFFKVVKQIMTTTTKVTKSSVSKSKVRNLWVKINGAKIRRYHRRTS